MQSGQGKPEVCKEWQAGVTPEKRGPSPGAYYQAAEAPAAFRAGGDPTRARPTT